ncbi:MAG: hypothetical protein CMN76_12400 [Spirochaetaceae bacterium]|nr:hypothetical protein [Spirochaetaceae bacterium]|tara:strand:+ start:45797 stop:46492 length:696 start_codon:yes stop_codon:yes gene_type:complete
MVHGRLSPEERRKQILVAARTLISQAGVESVRVEDILQQLSLSKGGFYHHFRSLDEVLRELITEDLAGLLEDLRYRTVAAKDSIDALIALFDFGSDDRQGSPGILPFFSSRGHKLQYLEVLEDVFYEPLGAILTEILRAGMAADELRPGSPSSLALIFQAVNRQFNRQAILDEATEYLADERQLALRMLFRELGVLEEPRVQSFLRSWTEEQTGPRRGREKKERIDEGKER